ncbi:MAG TPA: DUF378 domain-containing protein [Candidatus Limnocylindria bacterium]|nr:DUF378 domain-containing protein [Candidatus Limnocylindria bacterium]
MNIEEHNVVQILKTLALVLVIVGGLNWLLVGFFKLDLVAAITGSQFGEVNPASTIVYALVGVSAFVLVPTVANWATSRES